MPVNIVMIITCVVCAMSLYRYNFDSEVSYIKSNLDNNYYLVVNGEDNKSSADELAKLRIRLDSFVKHMHSKKNSIQNCGLSCKQAIERMYTRFISVLKESKPSSKLTSYTVNKGPIYMCIRDKDNREIIDENTLIFVALHELAHVMTRSIGHTKEFWRNFAFLLKHAIKDGYYQYHPYHQMPKKYCGTMITDTPYKL